MKNNNNLLLQSATAMAFTKLCVLLVSWITISACTSTHEQAENSHVNETYQVLLEDKQGNSVSIGIVEKNGKQFKFERDDAKFKDFFLSMKEMKCLEGAEILCHIHYPYPQENVTEQNNVVWLSHQLLFMYKRADQFGARLRQGVYFRLVPDENGFKGIAYSLDLNDLASPPDDLSIPPIDTDELELLEIDERWLPYMQIKPIK